MRMRIALTRMHAGVALGGTLVCLAFWVRYPTNLICGTPRPLSKSVSLLEGAPQPTEKPKDSLFPMSPGAAPTLASAAVPTGTPSAFPKPAPKVGPPGGRWDYMKYLEDIPSDQGEAGRQEAIRRTAAHLSIDAALAPEFEEAAQQSVLEMEQALEVRKGDLSSLPPAERTSTQSEPERQSEERYAAARVKALERLEKFLAQSPVQQEFRWAFDSWASTVASKTRVEGR